MCDMPGGAGRRGRRVRGHVCHLQRAVLQCCSSEPAADMSHPATSTAALLTVRLSLYNLSSASTGPLMFTSASVSVCRQQHKQQHILCNYPIYHLTSCLYYQLTLSFTIDTRKDIQYIFYSMLVKPAAGSPGVCRWLCARWWRTPTRRPCP